MQNSLSPDAGADAAPAQLRTRRALGRGWLWRSAAMLLSVLALAASPAHAADPIKIGMSTALTGPYSEFGIMQRNAVEIAVDQFNAKGGIKGRPIQIVLYDDGLVPARAQANVRRLIDDDKVAALIAPAGSGPNLAVNPLAIANNLILVNIVAQTTTINYPDGMDKPPTPNIFSFSVLNAIEAEVLSDYVGQRFKKIALMSESTSLGKEQLDFITKRLKDKYKLTPVAREEYKQQDPDMTAQIARIQAADADVIVLVGIGADAAVIKKGLNRIGFKGVFIGAQGVQSQPYKELAGDLVVGSRGSLYRAFAEPAKMTPAARAFADAYVKKFGNDRYYGPDKNPAPYFGILTAAYDGAIVLFQAMDRAKSLETKDIIAELESGKPFPAARLDYTFSKTRHHAVGPEMLGVYEYAKEGNAIVMKPAP
jgi:branched-chain amino acid transport system substrate-binding protein